jgi:hypothetical protein
LFVPIKLVLVIPVEQRDALLSQIGLGGEFLSKLLRYKDQ